MRKWVKFTLAGVALAMVGFMTLAGTGAYYFLRHLETKTVTEAETKGDFEAIRARFAGRAPLIEITNLKAGDIKVQRAVHPEGRRAVNLHVLTWDAKENQLMRTDVPLWLMRFSSINILSRLGIAPDKFRLTAEDIAAFGPGIVVDYRQPGASQVLIWVE